MITCYVISCAGLAIAALALSLWGRFMVTIGGCKMPPEWEEVKK